MFTRLTQRIINSNPLYHWLLIIAVGSAIYANTLGAPFLFDDLGYIKYNKAISSYFDDIPKAEKYAGLYPDVINSMDARKVVYFTFALNHLLHGHDVTGYHLVNILIHLATALAVYYLLATLFKTAYFEDHPVDNNLQRALPLVIALLFVSHPIQTLAVTYTIQRFTSMATLFYLLAVTLYLQARLSARRKGQIAWLAAAVATAVMGMFSKEIAFTIPILAVVCELLFFKGNWSKRALFLLPLICTMAIIPLNMLSQVDATNGGKELIDDAVNLANLDSVSQKSYLLTQFRVMFTYFRLLLLPVNQHLDYDYPSYRSLLDLPVALSAFFLLAIVLSALWAYRKSQTSSPAAWPRRLYCFGIAWFFVTISVSSSIIPLSDMIFEYRLYLPSTGFFISATALVVLACQKLELPLLSVNKAASAVVFIILVSLCFATVSRNNLFRDRIRFWEDNVAKAPLKKRPHKILAIRYRQDGKIEKNIRKKYMFIALNPDSPDNFKHWNDIAVDSVKIENFDYALEAIEHAMAMRPDDPRLQATYNWILSYTGTAAPAPALR
jgi:hypothetical protein